MWVEVSVPLPYKRSLCLRKHNLHSKPAKQSYEEDNALSEAIAGGSPVPVEHRQLPVQTFWWNRLLHFKWRVLLSL